MSNQNNISSFEQLDGDKHQLSEDKLMAYLEGKLSPEEQHEVEQWLGSEGMESDALEGLHNMGAGPAKNTVFKLNHQLHKSLTSKKRKRSRPLDTGYFTWIAIGIILLLVVVAFLVIKLNLGK